MKILLLGSMGNLGTELEKSLRINHELICWESSDIDLKNIDQLSGKIQKLDIDAIINTIAYNAVDKCENDEGEYVLAQLLNIKLLKVLANSAQISEAVLMHYSSDYVFGAYQSPEIKEYQIRGGFSESDIPKTNNRYAYTKFLGEQELIKLDSQGLKYYLIRTSKLFGKKGESEFAKPNFFEIMRKISETKSEIDVVDAEISCFTYIPDLAKASLELLTSQKPWGVYHLVNEGADTWYQASVELFRALGKEIKINPVSPDAFLRPAKRPEYSALLNTKFKKLRSYKEALKEYLKDE